MSLTSLITFLLAPEVIRIGHWLLLIRLIEMVGFYRRVEIVKALILAAVVTHIGRPHAWYSINSRVCGFKSRLVVRFPPISVIILYFQLCALILSLLDVQHYWLFLQNAYMGYLIRTEIDQINSCQSNNKDRALVNPPMKKLTCSFSGKNELGFLEIGQRLFFQQSPGPSKFGFVSWYWKKVGSCCNIPEPDSRALSSSLLTLSMS